MAGKLCTRREPDSDKNKQKTKKDQEDKNKNSSGVSNAQVETSKREALPAKETNQGKEAPAQEEKQQKEEEEKKQQKEEEDPKTDDQKGKTTDPNKSNRNAAISPVSTPQPGGGKKPPAGGKRQVSPKVKNLVQGIESLLSSINIDDLVEKANQNPSGKNITKIGTQLNSTLTKVKDGTITGTQASSEVAAAKAMVNKIIPDIDSNLHEAQRKGKITINFGRVDKLKKLGSKFDKLIQAL